MKLKLLEIDVSAAVIGIRALGAEKGNRGRRREVEREWCAIANIGSQKAEERTQEEGQVDSA